MAWNNATGRREPVTRTALILIATIHEIAHAFRLRLITPDPLTIAPLATLCAQCDQRFYDRFRARSGPARTLHDLALAAGDVDARIIPPEPIHVLPSSDLRVQLSLGAGNRSQSRPAGADPISTDIARAHEVLGPLGRTGRAIALPVDAFTAAWTDAEGDVDAVAIATGYDAVTCLRRARDLELAPAATSLEEL